MHRNLYHYADLTEKQKAEVREMGGKLAQTPSVYLYKLDDAGEVVSAYYAPAVMDVKVKDGEE